MTLADEVAGAGAAGAGADSPRAAIVLAGGRSSRLGGARKVTLDVGGSGSLERVVRACSGWCPAPSTLVVGPADLPVPDGVVLVTDDPPFGGPVSGLRAGLAQLSVGADPVAVLAGDQPFVTAVTLERLVAALGSAEVAALGDAGQVGEAGQVSYLTAVWRGPALRRRVAAAGASMRSVFAGAEVVLVPDTEGWAADIDTPDDLRRARRRAAEED